MDLSSLILGRCFRLSPHHSSLQLLPTDHTSPSKLSKNYPHILGNLWRIFCSGRFWWGGIWGIEVGRRWWWIVLAMWKGFSQSWSGIRDRRPDILKLLWLNLVNTLLAILLHYRLFRGLITDALHIRLIPSSTAYSNEWPPFQYQFVELRYCHSLELIFCC